LLALAGFAPTSAKQKTTRYAGGREKLQL